MGNWTQSNTNTTDNYAETFRYDANGNILQLNRNGNSQHPGGLAMDRLNYTYRDGTNQLWSVQDGIAAGAYAGDIDNQGGSNYSYDRIGILQRRTFGFNWRCIRKYQSGKLDGLRQNRQYPKEAGISGLCVQCRRRAGGEAVFAVCNESVSWL